MKWAWITPKPPSITLGPWKNCLPWNWSLVPKRLGTAASSHLRQYHSDWGGSSMCPLNIRCLCCVRLFVIPMGCSPPGFSIHEIFQARILEWVAISFSRGSSWPRDWTPHLLCLLNWQAGSLPSEPPRKHSYKYHLVMVHRWLILWYVVDRVWTREGCPDKKWFIPCVLEGRNIMKSCLTESLQRSSRQKRKF